MPIHGKITVGHLWQETSAKIDETLSSHADDSKSPYRL